MEDGIKRKIEDIILNNFKNEWSKISAEMSFHNPLVPVYLSEKVFVKGITNPDVLNDRIINEFSIYNTDKKVVYDFCSKDVLVYNFIPSHPSIAYLVGPQKLIITYEGIYQNYTSSGIVFQNIVKYIPYKDIKSINVASKSGILIEYNKSDITLSCSPCIIDILTRSICELCKVVGRNSTFF